MKYSTILVDGMNTLFRAAHSYNLSVMDGEEEVPTGAIYGFLQMVLSVWKKHAAPDCKIIVCWDAGYDHRIALYPEYKAHRRAPKDPNVEVPAQFSTLRDQGKALKKILTCAGWRQARAPGYEADDVMAALSRTSPGMVALYTGDEDLHQCVSESVHVLSRSKGVEKIWTVAEVTEKWGLPPVRVAEAKALAGDGGDGIPGCPGCGLGWAQKILQGRDVSEVLAQVRAGSTLSGEYQGKSWKANALSKKLAENEEIVLTSWELAKVVYDCPVDITTSEPNQELLRKFLTRLSFNSLLEAEAFLSLNEISKGVGLPARASHEPLDLDTILGLDL